MQRSSKNLNADASQRQQQVLDYVLNESNNKNKETSPVNKVSIAEAREGQSHFEVTSERETTRLLFISQDTSLLNQTTQSLDGYLNLSDVFDEVHIVVLQSGIKARNPVLRVANNVWLYVASAPTPLGMVSVAKYLISEQLVFAGGFRADMIVARDPLESAVVALWASQKFDRVAQVHVLEDFTDATVFAQYAHPRISRFLFDRSMRLFPSVRTMSESVQKSITIRYPHIADIATLPRFLNLKDIDASNIQVNIKDKYRDFSFIIMYVGKLDHHSLGYQAIDTARTLMRNPKVGLVVLGDGTSRSEFQKRTKILGIEKQVVFEKTLENLRSYLKTADVLFIPETDENADANIIQAAAAGLPIVASETQYRSDIFKEGESALFFNTGDIESMSHQLSRVLNDLQLRSVLRLNGKRAVEESLHEDPVLYQIAYRDSVEAALFLDSNQEQST